MEIFIWPFLEIRHEILDNSGILRQSIENFQRRHQKLFNTSKLPVVTKLNCGASLTVLYSIYTKEIITILDNF